MAKEVSDYTQLIPPPPEDLVEEILGEIEDEHDTSNYIAKKLNATEYVLSARLEIEKINEMFGLELPENDDYLTPFHIEC